MKTPHEQVMNYINKIVDKEREKYSDGYKHNYFEWEDYKTNLEELSTINHSLRDEIFNQQKIITGLEMDRDKLKNRIKELENYIKEIRGDGQYE